MTKGLKIGMITGVNVLPNGNMVLGIYAAVHAGNGATIIKVTRDKKGSRPEWQKTFTD